MKPAAALLSLALLLSACSDPVVVDPPPDDDVPSVARTTRSATAPCTLPQALAEVGGPAKLQGVNFLPGLHGQLIQTPSLYDLLYAARSNINGNYWGHSSVDLQALHEQYETKFRTTFGNLKEAALNTASDELMNEYVDGVQDQHTYFMDQASYQRYLDVRNGSSTSTPRFGFTWHPVPQEDGAVILDTLPGTPAFEAGLVRGDTILSVNGTLLTRQATDDATLSALQTTLSSAAQTAQPVSLTLRRGAQILNLTVTPRIINSAPHASGKVIASGVYLLRLPTFSTEGIAQEVHALLHQAQDGGAQTVVLDLRDNGGGLLDEAVAIGGAFNPTGSGQTVEFLRGSPITYAYRSGQVMYGANCTLTGPALTITNPATWTGHTLVLVNENSASASEVVSQYLTAGGARLYGEQTVGVGNSVINIYGLPGTRGLGVTVGISRDLQGHDLKAQVTPSPQTPEDLRALAHGTDTILQAALNSLK